MIELSIFYIYDHIGSRDMFHNLSKGLSTFLKGHLPEALVDSVSISFAAPDSTFPPSAVSLPAINLFLYDIRENIDLRGKEWFLKQPNGGGKKFHPIQVECAYIITAWIGENIPDPTMEEHRLLGETLKILLKHRAYPNWADEGIFSDGSARVVRAMVLQPDYIRMGEFWQAMGGKPRVAIHYQVSLSIDVQGVAETYPVNEVKRTLIKR
jgi:hypothetical protein